MFYRRLFIMPLCLCENSSYLVTLLINPNHVSLITVLTSLDTLSFDMPYGCQRRRCRWESKQRQQTRPPVTCGLADYGGKNFVGYDGGWYDMWHVLLVIMGERQQLSSVL